MNELTGSLEKGITYPPEAGSDQGSLCCIHLVYSLLEVGIRFLVVWWVYTLKTLHLVSRIQSHLTPSDEFILA